MFHLLRLFQLLRILFIVFYPNMTTVLTSAIPEMAIGKFWGEV